MQNYTAEVSPGKGFRFIQQGKLVHYFDQYYSFSECKWKASTIEIGEKLFASNIPMRRATNLFSFIGCIWVKGVKKLGF